MKVDVQYFAVLREQRGLSEEKLETSAKTYCELYEQLMGTHGFRLPSTVVKVAVNTQFAQMDDKISEGDKIVFIPPVAGG